MNNILFSVNTGHPQLGSSELARKGLETLKMASQAAVGPLSIMLKLVESSYCSTAIGEVLQHGLASKLSSGRSSPATASNNS